MWGGSSILVSISFDLIISEMIMALQQEPMSTMLEREVGSAKTTQGKIDR